jgi:hypothetical protein
MIITYMRSSSYTCLDFCEHKYYLDYCLGYNSPANKSAQKGSIVHKALEMLAQTKLAKQQGQDIFYNKELDISLNVHSVYNRPDLVMEKAYTHYVSKHEFEYSTSDCKDCYKWMHNVLEWKNGMFNPLLINIAAPEKYFDFTIKNKWAKYSYTLQGKKLSGQLSLKGTMDLTVDRGNNVIEVIDWKTGRRWDWIKRKPKDYEELKNDPQLLIYYYAARKLYPKADSILFTIYWIATNEPFSLPFDDSDYRKAEQMLRKRFEYIKSIKKPKLIYPNNRCNWCWFSNHSVDGSLSEYSNSICKQVKDEIIQLGIDKVTAIRMRNSTYTGGGLTHGI